MPSLFLRDFFSHTPSAPFGRALSCACFQTRSFRASERSLGLQPRSSRVSARPSGFQPRSFRNFLRNFLRNLLSYTAFCMIAIGLFFFASPSSANALSKREKAQRYRTITRQIQKGYNDAIKLRYREPCVAYNAIPSYIAWLQKLEAATAEQPLLRYQIRSIQRNIRNKRNASNRWTRSIRSRCQRYWNDEWKRQPPAPLSKACKKRFDQDAPGQEVWIGVRPWAYVYVDDLLCGTAPLRVKLPNGTYTIRLDFPPGRDSAQFPIQITQTEKLPILLTRTMANNPTPPNNPKKQPDLLSAQQIKLVLQRHKADLKSCQLYQPDAQQITLSWRITPQGKTEDVQWVSPSDAPKRFQDCVMRAATRWRFPKARANADIKDYPIPLQ
jgi:hypothetical protein